MTTWTWLQSSPPPWLPKVSLTAASVQEPFAKSLKDEGVRLPWFNSVRSAVAVAPGRAEAPLRFQSTSHALLLAAEMVAVVYDRQALPALTLLLRTRVPVWMLLLLVVVALKVANVPQTPPAALATIAIAATASSETSIRLVCEVGFEAAACAGLP